MSFERHAGYGALLPRLPSNLQRGKQNVIVDTMERGAAMVAKAVDLASNDGISALGRARALEQYLKTEAAPAFAKSHRQLQHHRELLDGKRAALRKETIGKHDSLDSERRAVLRQLEPAARVAAVLSDPEMRSAALRGGATLAGVGSDELDRAYGQAAQETAPAKVAEITALEKANDYHRDVLRIFEMDLQKMPCKIEPNGAVVALSPGEVQKLIESLPAPQPHIAIRERVEADKVDDATS